MNIMDTDRVQRL